MKGVDEENIRGEEGAQRAAADEQRGDVEDGGAILDLPDGREHHQRGEQGEDDGNSIRTDGEAERWIFEDRAGMSEGEAGFAPVPVSYTHLDVYKRQGLHLPAGRWRHWCCLSCRVCPALSGPLMENLNERP